MYIATSVAKPAGISPGSASPKKANVTIFDFEDVAYFPPRDSKGILVTENILMKAGKKMVQVYLTRSKITAGYESDGDEDSINIANNFEGQHPGNKVEIREFIQNWLGRNVGIIFETCDGQKELVGTPCAPLQLKPSKQDNNDGLFQMLKFEAFAKSNLLPALYTGALTLSATQIINAAAGIQLMKTNRVVYAATTFPGINIEFQDMDTLEHDDVVTVGGLGGEDPVILEEGVQGDVTVILKDGTTWVALAGSFINLKYFKSGAVTYLIEQSRG
jgi:hypothetical protein